MNVHGRWRDPADDARVRDWARKASATRRRTRPAAATSTSSPRTKASAWPRAYGANYARLQAVKQRFDPGNLFRMNLNIAPAGGYDERRRHDRRRCTRLLRLGREPAAAEAFERALAALPGLALGAEAQLATALQDAPDFVMAHVLQAYLLVCSRDPRRVALARRRRARCRAAGQRARAPPRRRARRGARRRRLRLRPGDASATLLPHHPRDPLALQAAHSLDYVTGDVARHERDARRRGAAVLVDRPARLPRRARHARLRSRGERRATREAEANARSRPGARTRSMRAPITCMAHVFEMTGRADGGRALARRLTSTGWSERQRRRDPLLVAPRPVPARPRAARAARSRIYDERVRAGGSDAVADLIDAVGAALAHRARRRRDRRALARARRRLGAAHRRRASAASTTCTRCWRSSARATGAARAAPRAHAARGAVAADPPWRDDAPARPGRLPCPDRLRPRRRCARDHAARQPAAAWRTASAAAMRSATCST